MIVSNILLCAYGIPTTYVTAPTGENSKLPLPPCTLVPEDETNNILHQSLRASIMTRSQRRARGQRHWCGLLCSARIPFRAARGKGLLARIFAGTQIRSTEIGLRYVGNTGHSEDCSTSEYSAVPLRSSGHMHQIACFNIHSMYYQEFWSIRLVGST
jgi:hypothetical protein